MTHAYVALAPCGCIAAWVPGDPLDALLNAHELPKFVRSGYRVEHMPAERMREFTGIGECPHKFKLLRCA